MQGGGLTFVDRHQDARAIERNPVTSSVKQLLVRRGWGAGAGRRITTREHRCLPGAVQSEGAEERGGEQANAPSSCFAVCTTGAQAMSNSGEPKRVGESEQVEVHRQ